jgi:AIPR protein
MNGRFHVRQIEGAINQLFKDSIDLSDLEPKKQTEINFLSRGLAAYSLYVLAGIDTDVAAQSVVDGYEDNGIDAIYYDKKLNTIWIVQSKWIQKGQGQPETGDMRKFKDGILDLREERLGRFNERVKARKEEISTALGNPGIKIRAVIAYTGLELSKHNRTILEDLVKDLNDYDEIGSYEIFNLESAFKALADSINSNSINVECQLSNWGKVDEPFEAFYGQISAVDVAKWWAKYNNKLFSRNIRNFIGSSEVNDDISRTILEEPEIFWYFNNGITVLCQEIHKKGISKDRKIGEFICKGISVINGAQTIGSIGNVYEEHPEKVENADIFVKFISLENCPDGFSVRVTRATNTQNKVENRDFVSLDVVQERLRRELQVWGKTYHYKRTENLADDDSQSCNLQEATIALSCANADISLSIYAKKEISKLWSDTSKEPYKAIFNDSLKAVTLWRCVEVYRAVMNEIKIRKKNSVDKGESSFYEHAELFILHIVFQFIKKEEGKALSLDEFKFNDYIRRNLQGLISKSIQCTNNYLLENQPKVVHSRFFASLKKNRELKTSVLS